MTETLYKRGRDTILQWTVKVVQEMNKVDILKTYGVLNGGQAMRWQRNIKGKNIGKANQTTPLEQAIADAESMVRLKQREGYVTIESLSIDSMKFLASNYSLKRILEEALPAYNSDVNGNEIPMKCQQYYRDKKPWTGPDGVEYDNRRTYYMANPFAAKEKNAIIINFPCFIQPKVNGVRCFVKLVNGKPILYSKKGDVWNIPQVSDWFMDHPEVFTMYSDDVIYDGELYIKGESLQNIASAVKAYKIETMNVKLHIFDIAVEDQTQANRFARLYSVESKEAFGNPDFSPVVLVPTKKCINDERAQILTDMYIGEGYEGAIFRDPEGVYEFGKRPATITKLKRLEDAEFVIVDIVGQDKDNSIGMFVCVTPEGKQFTVNAKGDTKYKRSILLDPSSFIGKLLTIFFYEYTDDGKPFHITNTIVRDYE